MYILFHVRILSFNYQILPILFLIRVLVNEGDPLFSVKDIYVYYYTDRLQQLWISH